MGAWDVVYRKGLHPVPGSAAAYGALAIKEALSYNGYQSNMVMTTPNLGGAFDHEARAFQRAHALVVDGEVGPRTGAALFAHRFTDFEQQYTIPDKLVCRMTHLESACDPGAVGVSDPADLGIVQINMRAHPDISREHAFEPEWALDYLAASLRRAHGSLGDWDAAVAAWNVGGGGASAWLAAGKPDSLYEPWYLDPTGKPIDLGMRATRYVELVRGQSC